MRAFFEALALLVAGVAILAVILDTISGHTGRENKKPYAGKPGKEQ
jgi:hypothetical protein